VFSPSVYPMNPSWITGKMPAEIYKHEHPEGTISEEYFEEKTKESSEQTLTK